MMSFSLWDPGPQPFVVSLCRREISEKAGTGARAQLVACLSCTHEDFRSSPPLPVPQPPPTENSAHNYVFDPSTGRHLQVGI